MNSVILDSQALDKWAPELNGVFTVADLRNLLVASSSVELFRRIGRLQAHGILRRFCRGTYIAREFSLEAVSSRISASSYLSCGTVLSANLLIGSIPKQTVTAVKPGRNREYLSDFGNVIHLGISEHLIFDVEFDRGIRRTNSEKAFLDTLYFYQKGRRFSFDIYSDINIEALDKGRVRRYLKKYRNPRFVRFVENCIDG